MKSRILFYLGATISLVFGYAINGFAQQVTVGTNTLNTNDSPISISNGPTPRYSRSAAIYTAAEIIAAGGYAGTINTLAWYRTGPSGALQPNNNGKLKIYIKPIPTSVFDSTSKSWSLLKNNSILVYSDTTVNFGSSIGWKNLVFNTKYNWNGTDHLLVLVDWENPDSSASLLGWRYSVVANANLFRTNNSILVMSSLGRNSNRPNIQFGFSKNLIDAELKDLEIERMKCVGDSVSVSCRLRNNSNSTINSFALAMSVNGIVKFSKIFSSQLASASDTTINFGKIQQSTLLGDNLRIWIVNVNNIADQINTNDTIKYLLKPALSGVYTVGTSGDFATLEAVVNAINARGICSNVTIDFDSTAGPFTGVYHLFNYNLQNTYTLTWKGFGTILNVTVPTLNTFNQQSLLYLHDVKNMIIDGFNFKYSSGYPFGSCVQVSDSSENIQIRKNTFYHQTQGAGNSISIRGNSEAFNLLPVKVNNVVIENNYFSRMRAAVEIEGTKNYPLNVMIRKNKIVDLSNYGLDINNAINTQIIENDIYSTQLNTTSASVVNGIRISGLVTGSRIDKNKIHNLSLATNVTSSQETKGINCSSVSGLSISNNLIYNVANDVAKYYGVYCYLVSDVSVDYNTISSGNNSVITGLYYGIFSLGNNKLKVRNNIFHYNSSSSTQRAAVYITTLPDTNIICDYNLYYINGIGTGTNLTLKTGTANYSSLAQWKLANAGLYDLHSVEGDPVLINVSSGNLLSNSILTNSIATPISTVPNDFNGSIRSTTNPDIGAYEYNLISSDGSLQSIMVPTSECGNPQIVKVKLRNIGSQQIDSVEFNWMVNGVVQTPQKLVSVIAFGAEQLLTIGSYPMVFGSNYTIKAWIKNVNGLPDQNPLNDTAILQFIYSSFSGVFTVGGPTANFPTLTAALQALSTYGICSTVTLSVDPKYGPYNEQVTINPIAGLSQQKKLILKGNGAEFYTTSTATTNNYVMRLNGVSHVTIDSFIIRTNPSNSNGFGIHLKSNSNYNTIINNRFFLYKTSTNSQSGIFFNAGESSTLSSGLYRGNIIEKNIFDGGYNCVKFSGTTTNKIEDSETIIRKNYFVDFISSAISIYDMDSTLIYENEFYHKSQLGNAINTSKAVAMNLTSPDKINRIYNNRIHDLVNNTSLSKDIQVFDVICSGASTVGKDLIIENNLVYNINTGGKFYFFSFQNLQGVRLLHNTISVNNVASMFSFAYSTSSSNVVRHYYYNNLNYINNASLVYLYNSGIINFSGLKSDYNSFFRGNSTSLSYNQFYSSYSDWKATIKCDSNSKIQINQNLFANYKVFPNSSSVVIAAGKGNQGVLTDYFGNPRSLSNPSIGAIEIGRSEMDGPVISYSKLQLTSSVANRQLANFAYIVDTSGIDTSAANRPRLYYKKKGDNNIFVSNTKGAEGWKYVKAINTASPFSFQIDYRLLKDSSVTPGDLIEYFVFAKDKLGNGSISNFNFTSDFSKNTVIDKLIPFASTFDFYGVGSVLPDTIFVGDQHPVKSLTRENGLFKLLQNNYLSKNLTVVITSDLTEDGSYTFKKANKKNIISALINIVPLKNSTFTISSINKKPIIQFDGADTVNIGSNSKASRLIFKKNIATYLDTSYVIVINADSVKKEKSNSIVIRNCDFQTVGNAKYSIGVYAGIASNGIFLFDNNFIGNKFGVFLNPDPYFNTNKKTHNSLVLTGNRFTQDTLILGVNITQANGVIITGNTFDVGEIDRVDFKGSYYVSNAINVMGHANEITISGNRIFYNAKVTSGSNFYAIQLLDTNGINRDIINNLIVVDFKSSYSADDVLGVSLYGADSVEILNNTILFKGILNKGQLLNCISVGNSKRIKIINNSLQNIVNYNGNSSYLIDMTSTAFKDVEIDYNHYQINEGNNGLINNNGVLFDSLSHLLSFTNTNVHSIVGDPNTLAISNLPGNMLLYAKALKLSKVYRDNNNVLRPAKPTIGAFEKDSIVNDIEISKIITPTNCIDTIANTHIEFVVRNNGTTAKSNFNFEISWGNKPSETLLVVNNSIIEPSQSKVISFNLNSLTGKLKNGFLKIKCLLPNDQNENNDSVVNYFNNYSGTALQLLNPIDISGCADYEQTILSGDKIYRNIEWYDAPVGGNLIGVGSSLSYRLIKNDSLYLQPNENDEVDTLGTGKLVGASSNGVFFNIINNNPFPINIKGLDLYTQNVNATIMYNVYRKTGAFSGFESNATAWKLIKNNSASTSYWGDNGRRFFISLDSSTIILPNQSYAFFVERTYIDFLTTIPITNGKYSYSKDGVSIEYGSSKSNPGFASSTILNRLPQLSVYYNKVGKCYKNNRLKVKITAYQKLAATVKPVSANIIVKQGTLSNPDIVCDNKSYSYRMNAPSGKTDADYGVTWVVIERRYKIAGAQSTINYDTDTNRRYDLFIPSIINNKNVYEIRYTIRDITTGCPSTISRYVVLLKHELVELGISKQICAGDSIKLKSNILSPYVSYLWSNGKTDSVITVKTQGTYKLKVSFGNCSFSEDSVFVKVIPSFDSLTVIQELKDSCRYVFHTNVIPNAILNWDFGDGFTATGNIASHIYNANGTYKVKLSFIEPNSCIRKNTSEVKVTIVCFSGLENQLENDFQIYPNPSSGVFHISTAIDIDKIEVFSMDGKLVKECNTIDIDLSTFPDAFYTIRIISKNGVAVKKLWKQN